MNDLKHLISYKAQQSPIDFGRAEAFNCVFPGDYLAINWGTDLEGHLETTDEGVKYVFDKVTSGQGLYLSGDFFLLDQIHFHAPSEHKINGAEAEVELHIVHMQPAPKPENDQYVVLGIWVNSGNGKEGANRFFKHLTEQLKAGKEPGGSAKAPVALNPNDLLPPCPEEFWRYEGSLTTKVNDDNPESVRWVFYRQPLPVSREILEDFLKVGHHAKPIQPLNRRFVLSSLSTATNSSSNNVFGSLRTTALSPPASS